MSQNIRLDETVESSCVLPEESQQITSTKRKMEGLNNVKRSWRFKYMSAEYKLI